MLDLNRHAMRLWMGTDQPGSAFHKPTERFVCRMKGFSSTAEDEQRLQHVSHSMHCELYVEHQFISFRRRSGWVAEKLGICIDGGEIMPQVMRDGARHSPDYGQPG